MTAYFVCATNAVRAKYGSAAAGIIADVAALGNVVDVSGQSPEQIQAKIAALPAGAACLVGGYDLIPPFIRPNPTHGSQDDDAEIPTDAPYGATPGHAEEEYAPERAISRIPDSATADAAEFSALLGYQHAAPARATPPGSFEEAADEFAGALQYVHAAIPGAKGPSLLSPPAKSTDPGVTKNLSGHGRIHILLHGANYDPDWAALWGHGSGANVPFVKALTAQIFDRCDFEGAIVTFSSCYAAMLDAAPATHGARNSGNQVSVACLAHGAKVTFGATRSNWISTTPPYDGFGPRLAAEVWRQLARRQPAAEALRLAKAAYLKVALSQSPGDRPYALKTVLQAQCYGHPMAKL